LLQANKVNGKNDKKISVEVPNAAVLAAPIVQREATDASYKPVAKPESEPDPVAEPMPEPELPLPEPVPTPTPKPEPEPIPHCVEQKPWLSVFPTEVKAGAWALDPVLDIPTLAHQEKTVYELNDTMVAEGAASLNDKLKQNKVEMSALLQEAPIRDLKKAISINDRHRFIRELFRDDETMYERSVKTINSFHIFAEAEFWIQRELKVKLGWDTSLELVKTFDQLVRRRFS
jgi:hypothetical protein